MSDFKEKFIRYVKRMGAGSMLISIIVHVGILLVATIWVVSSAQTQRKAMFKGGDNAPSSVQHAVKMSNTQPHLDTLIKRLSVDTPNSAVALPDLPTNPEAGLSSPSLSTGLGAAGGAGGLKGPIMPMFGFKDAQSGNALVGRFYDLKQLRNKKPNPDLPPSKPIANGTDSGAGNYAAKEVAAFVKGGCKNTFLAKFFQAPTSLYATQIFIPTMPANAAPKAYGVEKEVAPKAWIAHYRGKVSPPSTGVYRFVGAGDDFLMVRINGRLVLDGGGRNYTGFKTDRPQSPAYPYEFGGSKWFIVNRGGATVGNRIVLDSSQFYDIDIVLCEAPGGSFCAFVLFEQEGVNYTKDGKGNPLLPIFRIANSKTAPSPNAPAFMADGPVWKALPPPKD